MEPPINQPPPYPQYDAPAGPGYNPDLPPYMQVRPGMEYETRNLAAEYGSIIKDLTDTEKILMEFELRLRGKKMENGKIVFDPNMESYIKTDRAAATFMDIVRSAVNRHNDFSFYEKNEINPIIFGANYTICRWLMLQGEDVPTRYRAKISFEAMYLINASLHKALNGRILTWTKGSFSEGRNITDNGNDKKSIWDYIIPFRKKGG